MDKKFSKSKLLEMDAVEIYKLVLQGKYIKKFPNGFWNEPCGIDNAKECVKYLIEDMLKLSEEKLKEQLNTNLFRHNKLRGMLNACFDGSPIKAIMETYPEKDFKPWEFKIVPQGYWTKETGIESVKWLMESKLRLNDDQLKEQLSQNLFIDNGLGGMLRYCFDNSPIRAIIESYPEKDFKPWEFNQVPKDYWTKETGILATKWLIESKLKLNDEEIKEQINQKVFIDNGLLGMLHYCFNYSPIQAVMESYPNKDFKVWEFKNISKNYWTIDTGIKSVRWLIDTKLKLTDDQLKEQLSIKLFENNGLDFMLESCFNSSPTKAIIESYPEKDFKPWEFRCVPKGYWNKETGILSIHWLINTKLKLNDEQLKEQLNVKMFKDNGLMGMLQQCFNNSPFKAIDMAYPNKFKKEDFKCYKYCK